jgi:hypothetical protein
VFQPGGLSRGLSLLCGWGGGAAGGG